MLPFNAIVCYCCCVARVAELRAETVICVYMLRHVWVYAYDYGLAVFRCRWLAMLTVQLSNCAICHMCVDFAIQPHRHLRRRHQPLGQRAQLGCHHHHRLLPILRLPLLLLTRILILINV